MRLAAPAGRVVAVDDVGLFREVAVPQGEGEWVSDAIWTQTGTRWTQEGGDAYMEVEGVKLY